jgi:hypothetical protein
MGLTSIMTELAIDKKVATRNADISFLLFALGGVVGLVKMGTATIPFGRGFEMVALAEHLARNGVYANPFPVLDTGLTAANPPMYPLLLALLFKLFKSQSFVLLAATIGVIFANSLTAAWLPRVSLLFYRDVRPGILAAILWLLSMPLLPSWDTSYTVAALLAFCLVSSETIWKQNAIVFGVATGLLAGVLFLFNPSTMLIFLPWLAYIAFMNRDFPGRTAGYCLAVSGVLALVVFAWMFRNHQQLGEFKIRTNLGMTLYSSNNDCAQPSLLDEEKTDCYQARHPNTSIEEAQLLRTLGEIEYDRLRIHDAKTWIRTHPESFIRLSLARFCQFWFPQPGEHPFEAVVIWISTVLSVPGTVMMILRRERATFFVLFVLMIYPPMYYVVVSDLRYRIPVLWLSLLPAGYFLSLLANRIRRPR